LADCEWRAGEHTFNNNFRFIPLGSYDGIIGLDWLASHSPMTVDWAQKWMIVPHNGGKATLTGVCEGAIPYTLYELSALLSEDLPPVHPAHSTRVLFSL
jgi:hypothetical protein